MFLRADEILAKDGSCFARVLEKRGKNIKACRFLGSRSAFLRIPARWSERSGGGAAIRKLAAGFSQAFSHAFPSALTKPDLSAGWVRGEATAHVRHCTVTASVTVWETA